MYKERVTEKMVEVGCLYVACVGREEEGIAPTCVFESQRGQAGWFTFHWPVAGKEGAWLRIGRATNGKANTYGHVFYNVAARL